MTLAQDIIARKRDGHDLRAGQIDEFVRGITDNSISDAQIGAFAMAVLLRGMTADERVALTEAMRDSGDTLSWDVDGPVLDKHSTGGVGDCVSLVLAPALAACGAYVPMISGRGLGHTGGTLDKLSSIPGYRADISNDKFMRTVASVGCAIVGQTADLAPADRRFYAIRDVSGTVDSVDLICASILSKKLAEGIGSLVLDIKCGNGAIAKSRNAAFDLARVLVDVANGAGCRTSALITDMNEPLSTTAGNALEVAQCMRLLRGDEVDARLWDVTVALGGMALHQADIAESDIDGRDRIAKSLQDGSATEVFTRMVADLGGPSDFTDNFDRHLTPAPIVEEVYAEQQGFIGRIDTQAIGRTVVELGGGRQRPDDEIDTRVGLDWLLGRGAVVDDQTPIARVHAASQDSAQAAKSAIIAAYEVSETVPDEVPLIRDRIT